MTLKEKLDDYEVTMEELSNLLSLDPEPDSMEGLRAQVLIDKIVDYDREFAQT